MSTLEITVTYSVPSLEVSGPSGSTIEITQPPQTQILQLGSISGAANQQITQAVASTTASAATATAAAATATSEAGVATAAAGTATAEAEAAAASATASANAYSAIANGTATSAGTLTGAETVPLSRGAGLLQTTLNAIADFVIGTLTLPSYSALRSYTGIRTYCVINAPGIAGEFGRLSSATGLSDNGGTIIFDGNGNAWQRLNSLGGCRPEWWGAQDSTQPGMSTFDSSAALNACLAALPVGGTMLLRSGAVYLCNSLSIIRKSFGIKGEGPSTFSGGGATLMLNSSTAAQLLLVGKVSDTAPGGIVNYTLGVKFENVLFHGNNLPASDSLLTMLGVAVCEFDSCGVQYSNGCAMRMQACQEFTFNNTVFRRNSAPSSQIILFDDVVASNGQNNVNDINFLDKCHFEANTGTIFRSSLLSGLFIFRVTDAKFEWGGATVPGSPAYSIFDLNQCSEGWFTGLSITNFSNPNGFLNIFRLGS